MLLEVMIDGVVQASVDGSRVPGETTIDVPLQDGASEVVFRGDGDLLVRHALAHEAGWGHFSVRVHENLACQADCVVSPAKDFDPRAFGRGEIRGVRFQPFFLGGAKVDPRELEGRGLFARGLHFSGHVSPGNLSLSCICDRCQRSFRLQSFHAGFSRVAYFYSGSGRHTLVVDGGGPGAPVPGLRALSEEDAKAISALEHRLPPAPDGTPFRYLNPLRCPHCAAPYIDFEAHPEMRPHEYYGNTFFGEATMQITSPPPSP